MQATAIEEADSLTISIGVAIADPAQPDEMVAVKHADRCLYRAKQTGRNRVVHCEVQG